MPRRRNPYAYNGGTVPWQDASPYQAMESGVAGQAAYEATVTVTIPVVVVGHSSRFDKTDTDPLHAAVIAEVRRRLTLPVDDIDIPRTAGGSRYHWPTEDYTPPANALILSIAGLTGEDD